MAIPQADEQQRLLVNLIEQMNVNKKPLPRFWYFPSGFKAVVIMTGDDHNSGGTSGRFDQYLLTVQRLLCGRLGLCAVHVLHLDQYTDPELSVYVSQGFEIANHADNAPTCTNFTPASSGTSDYSTASRVRPTFRIYLPPANRTHCVLWSDFDSEPQILLNHGIRLDTSYYYWPGSGRTIGLAYSPVQACQCAMPTGTAT